MLDQILQNKSDKIEIDVYYNGVLTNPTSVIIKQILNPSGVVLVSNAAATQGITTGRYYYTLAADKTATLGVHTAVWEFIILGTTYQHTQYFEIVSAIRLGYIVPKELRDASPLDLNETDYPDTKLQKFIDKATQIMDSYLGASINYSQYSEKIRCVLDKPHNGLHIQLKHRPIISVTSVSVMTTPSNVVDLDVTKLRINETAAYLEYLYDPSIPSYTICITDWAASNIVPVATISYTAGYTTVPERVKMAAISLCEQLIHEFEGDDRALAGFSIGDYTERFVAAPGTKGRGIIGADEVLELLKAYRQPMQGTGFYGPLG